MLSAENKRYTRGERLSFRDLLKRLSEFGWGDVRAPINKNTASTDYVRPPTKVEKTQGREILEEFWEEDR